MYRYVSYTDIINVKPVKLNAQETKPISETHSKHARHRHKIRISKTWDHFSWLHDSRRYPTNTHSPTTHLYIRPIKQF